MAEIQVTHHAIAEAEANARNALKVAKAINGENHVDVVQCEMRLGRLLTDTGRPQEGIALLQSAKRKILALVGPDDGFHTPQVLYQNGIVLFRDGRTEEGLADLESAVENRRRNRPGTSVLAQFLAMTSLAESEMGRFAQAEKHLDETKAILQKVGQNPASPLFDVYLSPRIRLALATEKYDEAAQLAAQFPVDTSDAHSLDWDNLSYELLRAEVASATHHEAEAIERASAVRKKVDASDVAKYYQNVVSRASFIEGNALLRSGDATSAAPLIERALQERIASLDANSTRIAEAQIALAECAVALHDYAKAKSLIDAATPILAAHAELRPQYRQSLQRVTTELSRVSRSTGI